MKMKIKKTVSLLLVLSLVLSLFAAVPAFAADEAERTQPAAMNIGYPTFKNVDLLNDVFDLDALKVSTAEDDIMMKIYEQDLANGGDSFYVDRILARTGVCNGNAGSNGNADGNTFLTRGRALYMYTSSPSVIGFGGSTAYHQPLTGNMYEITFYQNGSKISTSEKTAQRINYPSNWVSTYSVGSNLSLNVTKFISNENVAVTAMTLNNTSANDQTITVNAASGFVSESGKVEINGEMVDEVVGTVSSPSNLTTITTRMTGNGFAVDETGKKLVRELTVPAGESVELKVVMAFTTKELPGSTADYVRFASLGNLEAIRAQKAEYNLYWAENLPYIEVPNLAVQKAIIYRWWSERFNSLDANIPGYDYQYPITIEGVLGYNNAIVLTQPMHLQDNKWLRTPNVAYGQLLSVGNCSQSSAFLDNPGNRSNWNNHYGQYLGDAGLEAFNVIGGGTELAENLAYYFGHDATGQLEHYGNHIAGRSLIAYRNNYMTGNDADTISMSVSGGGTWKAHGENAYVWAAANAAKELYELTGDTEKAEYYGDLADKIRDDILELMWCDKDGKFETYAVSPSNSFAKHNPNNTHLVDLTESNNWNYFAVGLVPTDEASLEKYKTAFEDFSNGEEFPIFPMFTANQVDNRRASGSNNFSNINFTVQARAYEAAIRTYDRNQEYITDEMLAMMTEWMAWLIYPDSGDVRYPNNSEYYNIDGRTYSNYYRSWIYHNILGNYNYIFFEDMAGLTPRSDEKIELFPIDFKYDHFMVNNARYHGHDLSVVWDDPTDDKDYYEDLPEGYTLFIDGERAFTLKTLSHVVYDAAAGEMEFPDGEAEVTFCAKGFSIPTAIDTVLTGERINQMLETAGMHGMENVAEGAQVTASFTPSAARAASWAEKHRADGSDSTSTAVNEMKPDPQAVVDGTTVNMPFWGNYSSTNESDSLILKLDEPQKIDMAALYFYNDRQNNGYAEPSKYSIEYWDGEAWHHMPDQSRYPAQPQANYNQVLFSEVTTDQIRVTFKNKDTNFTAVTEIQLFSEGGERVVGGNNTAPTVTLKEDSTQAGNLHTAIRATVEDDGVPYDKEMTFAWTLLAKPEGADAILSGSNKTILNLSASKPGDYTLHFVVSDGELSAEDDITVTIKESASGGLGEDVAPDANVESDYTASWEKLSGINNPSFEPGSSNVGTGKGWGNWSQSVGSEHYVGYIWPSAVTIGGADVYWYDDGGGTQVPSKFRMQYMDSNGQWKDVNISTPVASAVAKNKYNRIEFTPVTTTRLRFYMTVKSGAAANGIYRFKVYASVDIASLETVSMATKPGVIPTLPATVAGYTEDGTRISVPVTWETISADMVATDATVTVKGINASTGKMTTATIYVRSDMDSATITDVAQTELTTKLGEMPALPTTILVGYNNGAKDNQNVSVKWNLTAADVAKVGDFTFEGEVAGTDTKALLILHVLANEDFENAQPVIALIDAIGTVATTEECKAAIDAARAAYDALSDGAKGYVTNAATLTSAESSYATLLSIKNVEDMIALISDEVTLADADAINAAYTAYRALSSSNRRLVSNATKLTDARTILQNMQAAKTVEDQIAAIGEVTLEKKSEIAAARTAYNALTDARKAYVPNLAVLEAAEAQLAKLKDPDGTAAAAVEGLIAAIGEVTTESLPAIEAARAAYDALTPEQKALVPNAAALIDAELAYPDVVAAAAVEALIDAIGEVTLESKDAIEAARAVYQALTTLQKNRVGNYAVLVAAEEAYAALPQPEPPEKLAAQPVIELIDAIGEVTVDSGDAIAAAREAYNALSAEAKNYVTNFRVLVDAEFLYKNLVAAAAVEALIADIGEVGYSTLGKVAAAREAYNALTNVQKALVSNYDVLVAAEEAAEQLGGLLDAFEDIKPGAWYCDAVEYMVAAKLMNGVETNCFGVNESLTRAQIVTILYRIEGKPAFESNVHFSDVRAGDWFTTAIEWAAANGIVQGVGKGKFLPNDAITREQLATILYRYASYKQYDVSAGAELDGFADSELVSDWAVYAMRWAVGEELINGKRVGEDMVLDPAGTATRAQACAIFQRFLSK